MVEQPALDFEAPAEMMQAAPGGDHPVSRDEQTHRVVGTCLARGPGGRPA